MFRVSTTPIIRSTQNCNYSLRYWSYFLCSYLSSAWPSLATLEGGSCAVPEAIGVHKTVTTASGTVHNFCASTSLQRNQASLTTLEGGSCTIPEAVIAVLYSPDDGCGWNPKHVERTCRTINRLLCVASRWTVIKALKAELNLIWHLLVLLGAHHILHVSKIRVNIDQLCTEP